MYIVVKTKTCQTIVIVYLWSVTFIIEWSCNRTKFVFIKRFFRGFERMN